MGETIRVTHKGYDITYSELRDCWTSTVTPTRTSTKRDSLEDAKKRIDNFLKAENKFKSMQAIFEGGWRDTASFRDVTITSVTDHGEAWIKTDKGERKKLSPDTFLAKSNEKNKAIVEQLSDLKKGKEKIQRKMDDLKDSMERIRIE